MDLGLFLMLPSHGLMIVATLAGCILQLFRELLPKGRADGAVAEEERGTSPNSATSD